MEDHLILAGLLLIAFDSMDPQEEIAGAVLPVAFTTRQPRTGGHLIGRFVQPPEAGLCKP
jgi:hypothetical protein